MGDFPTFGVYVRPTTSIKLSNTSQFQRYNQYASRRMTFRPELDFTNCTVTSNYFVYATRSFSASGAFYLIDNSRFDNSFVDTAVCVYRGQFNLTNVCNKFVICQDTSSA